MMSEGETDITRLMQAAHEGDVKARESLWQRVYDELRKIARGRLKRVGSGDIQSTALVHDAYLRLARGQEPSFESRGEFYRAAASAMRNVLVDEARRSSRLKRGGDRQRVTLSEVALQHDQEPPEIQDLDAALQKLESVHPRVAQLIEVRYFAGLTIEEAAGVLDVSAATVERDWSFGKTWLLRELQKRRD
jgi:RNA polymerase sigma factor (TIGR02999 family)